MTLLVANRGEIALRIIRTAGEMSVDTVAVYAEDDADSPHVRAATEAVALRGSGPSAYLDPRAILDAAAEFGATAVHPGYGLLSENAAFARACAEAGLAFVGPSPDVLDIFGDKSSAREAAVAAKVPVLAATNGPTGLDGVRAFFAEHPGGIMIKALAGGGGRGIRAVRSSDRIEEEYRLCASEAQLGFGNPALFAEALLDGARHIEVQVVAAPQAGVTRALAVGDRDCSVQRRHQKLVEIAPAQGLDPGLRSELHEAAARLCASVGYRGLATVEFLVSRDGFVFLEVNPRIQVEHTVTEEVTGIDLVAVQIDIARGADYGDLSLPEGVSAVGLDTSGTPTAARGIAVQARVNMETMRPDGQAVPAAGTLSVFSPPTGPGVRVDTYGRPGLSPSPRYDSLLAKVIVHSRGPSFSAAVRKADAALAEFVVEGVPTNIAFLRAILADPGFADGVVGTDHLTERMSALVDAAQVQQPAEVASETLELRAGEDVLRAHMAGTVVESAGEGATVESGAQLVVLEAMKMQHVIAAPAGAVVERNLVSPGQNVNAGDPLVVIRRTGAEAGDVADSATDLDRERADLAEIRQRHEVTLDAARPAAIAKRTKLGRRSARANIDDLVDPGSFVEYGPLVLAAQRSRRSEQDLIENTPADGLVAGLATVNGDVFGSRDAQAVVLSYDYTVLAGTQGMRNHAKTDRVIELAGRKQVPVVLFAEGGGGRPGDTDAGPAAGLDLNTFRSLAALNGKVPLVSVVSGRCFAGNAALAGVCDVLIATPDANIGMGGPAMVEGGGLGVYRPEDIGPVDVQRRNGVIDLLARDEAHAVELARKYLSYFQGALPDWEAPDERLARHVVPENRLRAYDVRNAVESIADVGSVLELRRDHGVGIVTALIRVEGAPYGLVANSSHHLGGAIDAVAADKMARFLELCESFGLPVVSLCDTPGFMVGPDSEKEATVRRFGKLFVAGARMTVPYGTIILRKGYGLGAMAMAGGSFHASEFTVAWPTGEIGAMGLEGAVRLGFRKELEAIDDPAERDTAFAQLVDAAYQHGKALNAATIFELDDVIDPADSRAWIVRLRHP
ncbi:carboxyl transferase domain-containing protein [Rhodococcus sp. IEGM 1305]|uniref:acetyl-CoA carboxylase family protein n=1 Tax=Rhodococcus sp. IEGM 1305 TaxID=3047092 RepID=UPI0024B714D7|nr:carboxyl transferase domain-containing protein [Rhodococcus sp. IEGM 1305]MDI9948180.1 carboxyl transferase domain-containing protein [Rhodococcus sp. IEGM 1305]